MSEMGSKLAKNRSIQSYPLIEDCTIFSTTKNWAFYFYATLEMSRSWNFLEPLECFKQQLQTVIILTLNEKTVHYRCLFLELIESPQHRMNAMVMSSNWNQSSILWF